MMKFEVEYQNPKGALLTETVRADSQKVSDGVLQLNRRMKENRTSYSGTVFSVPVSRLVRVSPIEDDCCCDCSCDDNDLPLTNSLDFDLDLEDDEYIQIRSTSLNFNRTSGWSADNGKVEYKFTVKKESEDA